MGSTIGKNIRFTIFGESHGKGVGIVIDGLPAGIRIDRDYIIFQMQRRRPGRTDMSTLRNETDSFEILSGVFEGMTSGAPLCAFIKNSDVENDSYEKNKGIMRPSHADFTANIKYGGYNDYRGGGMFSGRLSAPMVFAGSICRQFIEMKGIIIGSHVYSIGEIEDLPFDGIKIDPNLLQSLSKMELPVIDGAKGELMKDALEKARDEQDSIGGIIEAAAINMPRGIGSPFFDSVESCLSHMLFSIPAIKGVEFGRGFEITKHRGSEANDEFYMDGENVRTYSNNSGGIQGGITNGMPVVFRVAVKPTASIWKEQRTVDILNHKETTIRAEGRHDPCIVPRALPVVESAAAMVIADLLLENRSYIKKDRSGKEWL